MKLSLVRIPSAHCLTFETHLIHLSVVTSYREFDSNEPTRIQGTGGLFQARYETSIFPLVAWGERLASNGALATALPLSRYPATAPSSPHLTSRSHGAPVVAQTRGHEEFASNFHTIFSRRTSQWTSRHLTICCTSDAEPVCITSSPGNGNGNLLRLRHIESHLQHRAISIAYQTWLSNGQDGQLMQCKFTKFNVLTETAH